MRKIIATPALIAAVLAVVTTFAPVTASAREGAQSIGGGIKCYNAYTQDADGTFSWKRICYKGV